MGAMQSLQCSAHGREPCKLSSSHEAENQFEGQKNYKNLKKKNLKEFFFFRVYMAMWPLLRIKTSSSRAGERCYTLRLESTVACQLFTVYCLLSTVYCLGLARASLQATQVTQEAYCIQSLEPASNKFKDWWPALPPEGSAEKEMHFVHGCVHLPGRRLPTNRMSQGNKTIAKTMRFDEKPFSASSPSSFRSHEFQKANRSSASIWECTSPRTLYLPHTQTVVSGHCLLVVSQS